MAFDSHITLKFDDPVSGKAAEVRTLIHQPICPSELNQSAFLALRESGAYYRSLQVELGGGSNLREARIPLNTDRQRLLDIIDSSCCSYLRLPDRVLNFQSDPTKPPLYGILQVYHGIPDQHPETPAKSDTAFSAEDANHALALIFRIPYDPQNQLILDPLKWRASLLSGCRFLGLILCDGLDETILPKFIIAHRKGAGVDEEGPFLNLKMEKTREDQFITSNLGEIGGCGTNPLLITDPKNPYSGFNPGLLARLINRAYEDPNPQNQATLQRILRERLRMIRGQDGSASSGPSRTGDRFERTYG